MFVLSICPASSHHDFVQEFSHLLFCMHSFIPPSATCHLLLASTNTLTQPFTSVLAHYHSTSLQLARLSLSVFASLSESKRAPTLGSRCGITAFCDTCLLHGKCLSSLLHCLHLAYSPSRPSFFSPLPPFPIPPSAFSIDCLSSSILLPLTLHASARSRMGRERLELPDRALQIPNFRH